MIIRFRIFIKLISILFSTVILQNQHGIFFKTCELCGGFSHTRLQSEHNDGVYNAKFQCNKCGAIGNLKEEWKKEREI